MIVWTVIRSKIPDKDVLGWMPFVPWTVDDIFYTEEEARQEVERTKPNSTGTITQLQRNEIKENY